MQAIIGKHVHVREAAASHDFAEIFEILEGKRTGRARHRRRHLDMISHHAHHFHHPQIVARRPPDRQIHAAALAEQAVQMGKGADRIVKEHAAEAREKPVIGCIGQRNGRGVGAGEGDIRRTAPFRALPRSGNQVRRNINAHDLAGRSDALRNCQSGRTTSAPEVHHRLAVVVIGAAEQGVPDRGNHFLEQRQAGQPFQPHVAGPVFRFQLFGLCALTGLVIFHGEYPVL